MRESETTKPGQKTPETKAETESAPAAPRAESPVSKTDSPRPESVGHVSGTGSQAKATYELFKEHNLSSWAAALTYFGVLALFPALIAVVSVFGIIGSGAIDPLLDQLTAASPGPARDLAEQALNGVKNNPGASGVTFIVGLALALWSASGYVSAFMDASNELHETDEDRSFVSRAVLRVVVTTLLLTLLGVCAVAVVVTGGIAREAGEVIGVGSTATDVWDIAKWPVVLLVVSFSLALLYWAAPAVDRPKFKLFTAGSVLAVVLWLAASALFALYVANFGSYNKTYGALGGAVVFLVWLWITNIAVLAGAALNAVRGTT